MLGRKRWRHPWRLIRNIKLLPGRPNGRIVWTQLPARKARNPAIILSFGPRTMEKRPMKSLECKKTGLTIIRRI